MNALMSENELACANITKFAAVWQHCHPVISEFED